jgi:hypothetical protein
MKYIKSYEIKQKHIPKFNINDPVKIKNDFLYRYRMHKIIYIVDGYDFGSSTERNICRLKKYVDKDILVNKEGMYFWIPEDQLELALDYEVDAIKYNL